MRHHRFGVSDTIPTDADVLKAVSAAKRAWHAAETKAYRRRKEIREEAFSRFGSTDVEQASRANHIRRIEIQIEEDLKRARQRYIERLTFIRKHAFGWEDLVPDEYNY